MNCRGVESKISAYLDGELGGYEMLTLRDHLSQCKSCSREMETIRAAKQIMSAIPDTAPDPEFFARLRTNVLEGSNPRRELFPWGHLAIVGSLAAACAVVIFVRMQRSHVAPNVAPKQEIASFDLNRDQAYVDGADSWGGRAPIVPASYGSR